MLQVGKLVLALGSVVSAACAAPAACTASSAVQRKEYGDLTSSQKLAYVAAVKCIMAKPSVLHDVPAATNHFDDFAAIHINMTRSIHIDGIFLAWHRHFLILMEKELHACGWPANLGVPYWNWTKYPNVDKSPIFDGSKTSLGGNGLNDPSAPVALTPSGAVLPKGSGGGCVTTGPFANHTIYFQPFDFNLIFSGLPANWAQPNPRCLTRDIANYGAQNFLDINSVLYMLQKTTVGDFNSDINGYGDSPGLHGGGHYTIGGVADDFFGSPQDPAFYLHHSMIDLVWNLWQEQDPAKRRYVYNGTSTIFNQPDTPWVTDSTVLSFGVLGQATVKQAQDPMANGYCYKYV